MDNDVLLTIADRDILGKTFKNDIELTVSEDFYHEDFCDHDKILELIKEATIVNAMGNDIVGLLLENGFVTKESVKNPAGIPHVQIVNL